MPENLVLCLDGTGNQVKAGHNTNVVRLYEMPDLSDSKRQMAFYDPGVGTFSSAGAWTPMSRWLTQCEETPADALDGVVHRMGRFWAAFTYRKRRVSTMGGGSPRVHAAVRDRVEGRCDYRIAIAPSEFNWASNDQQRYQPP